MTYLESFNFPDKYAEEDFRLSLLSTYHDIWHPFGVLSKHNIEFIKFNTITIFYGGNGSGKSTALNVISEKLKLSRDSERESLLQEYTGLKHSEFRLKSISDYDKLKRSIKAKKLTRSEFVRQTARFCKVLQMPIFSNLLLLFL